MKDITFFLTIVTKSSFGVNWGLNAESTSHSRLGTQLKLQIEIENFLAQNGLNLILPAHVTSAI